MNAERRPVDGWRTIGDRLHQLDIYAQGDVRVFALVQSPLPSVVGRYERAAAQGRTYPGAVQWTVTDAAGIHAAGQGAPAVSALASVITATGARPITSIQWAVIAAGGSADGPLDRSGSFRVAQDTALTLESAMLAAEDAARAVFAAGQNVLDGAAP